MTEREVFRELDPKGVTFKRFAEILPISGTMEIPIALVCQSCEGFIHRRSVFNVRREYMTDEEYHVGIKFSIKCPKCFMRVFFTIDPLNTDSKIKADITGQIISLNLEDN